MEPHTQSQSPSVAHDQAHQQQASVPWHQLFRQREIVQALEAIQDIIAISLCMGLFA